jgi:hypothetical protein
VAAGSTAEIQLGIVAGQDATYGPFIWANRDTSDPFAQYQVSTYQNLTGLSFIFYIRTQPQNTSALIYTTTAFTLSALQGYAGPAAPAYNNAYSWSVPNSASVNFTPGLYYFSVWRVNGSLLTPDFAGQYRVRGIP